ncbi:hypothetical protein PUN4_900028 [Paraburkholderia unamae]|nr:hypothetical protein PUN4_900028 [Paraburkholderia unamae]
MARRTIFLFRITNCILAPASAAIAQNKITSRSI